jgi:heavy metal translocating P-type ATPase
MNEDRGSTGAAWRRRRQGWRSWLEAGLLVLTLGGFLVGLGAQALGRSGAADACWIAGTLVAVVPASVWVVLALRGGRAGVDLLAVISLLGTLAVGEYLAGSLIAVMVATGRALDAAAGRRASRDLRALLERVPRSARRRRGDSVETVAVDAVTVGDLLVVGPGEVVPVDGRVVGGTATLDESALTGESQLVERTDAGAVPSGVVNAGAAFELRATAAAQESTYAGIVRLAQQAGADSAPVVRLADRYAAWFLPLSLAVATVAWLVSGSPVRAVAVLVVATPCPLLLAAPVAVVSGLSRASRIGVVVRSGGALEALAGARTLVMDKTGTLTVGRPTVVEIACAPDVDAAEVLRLAASAEQLSPHVLAQAIVSEARSRRLSLAMPTDVVEQPGRGTAATVDGRRVEVGKRAADTEHGWARGVRDRARLDGAAVSWVAVDGALDGAVLLRDPLRRDAPRTIRRLRAAGLKRLIMLTGDRPEPAREVATVLGLDEVCAEQSPADKVLVVQRERAVAVTVMIGDGINDAPALAAATVGVAMGARGATASSEAADVVLTVDRIDRLADAMEIARRARRIAVQSATAGMGLSLLAMAVAAAGWLPPAPGALLQEGIDVAVILNALRALRGPRGDAGLSRATDALVLRFAAEQDDLAGTLPLLRRAAGLLAGASAEAGAGVEALEAVRRAHLFLVNRLLPHELAEESELYPALAAPLGNEEATATMSRGHAEIQRLAQRLGTHLELADSAGGLDAVQVEDLLATLYGLYAVLRLHFVQEEEAYFSLADRAAEPAPH